MQRFAVALTIIGALFAASFSASQWAGANTPGTSAVPLLSCADVVGDGNVNIADVAQIVGKFGSVQGGAAYHPLYDVGPPSLGGINVLDIASAVAEFGDLCPAVDTEVARATLPFLTTQFQNEDPAYLATQGYFQGSSDVPGQGVHYVNDAYFNDDIFDPAHPEGLVYDNGKLAAQLYFVDGDAVGWGTNQPPPPYPPPSQDGADDTDIDAFCSPQPCSWSGNEGWHLHYYLCTVAIGSPQAFAFPGVQTAAQCENNHNNACGGQKCAGTTWRWNDQVGWMGHLWNHVLNANLIGDGVSFNGRFADCYPDPPWGWKAYNCPA